MPVSFRKTQRLSLRINVAIWAVCAILLLLFGFIYYGFEKQQLDAHIDQAKILLDSVYQQNKEDLANQLFSNQYEALMHTLWEINSVKGIAAVSVFSAQGRLLEWAGGGQRTDLPLGIRQKAKSAPLFQKMLLDDQNYLTYTTAVVVIGELHGYIRLFFNLMDLERVSQQRMLLIVGVFGVLLMVLSALLHLLLTHLVVRPVSRIRSAMDMVMNGELGRQVALDRKDEIGEVAASFNGMSAQLKDQRQRLLQSIASRNTYAQQLEESNRELERLNADLESVVAERTKELRTKNEMLHSQIQERVRADRARQTLEERLARSQKMEALGLLAGGVAHDLNNVLSGIVSYPELIMMDLKADDPICGMVANIQKSGHKAAAIVQDLLTLARRGVQHTAVLNINDDIIEDYLSSPEFQKMQSHNADVKIETHLSRDLMNIRGSAIHLKKAVMNLVSNAAEAQPQGGRIIVSTENRYVDRPIEGYEEVVEGDYVLLRVQDMGSGIAPDDLNRIFEPFYSKKKMGRSGTGLGMAVVWGTVQDHKGYINVDSRPNEGTAFELYFPVTREAVDQKNEIVTLNDYIGRGEKVLVIDDVEDQREIASAMLTRLQYDVASVESGEAALKYLKSHRVDILVLDMIMDPGMDGLDTYRGILEICPGQKAIIASGYAENERVKHALDLGAGAYIRKPYTLDKIAMAIRAELNPP